MWGFRRTLAILVLAAVGILPGGCELFEGSPASYFGGYPLKTYARDDAIIPGGIFRTLTSQFFSSVADLRPICTTDIGLIAPSIKPQELADLDLTASPQLVVELARVNIPGVQFGASTKFVESLRIQFTGVRRQFLEESEVDRVQRSIGASCRDLIRSHIRGGLMVFMVDGVVAVRQLRLTAQFSKSALLTAGVELKRSSINGLKLDYKNDRSVTYTGSDMVVEVFVKAFADEH